MGKLLGILMAYGNYRTSDPVELVLKDFPIALLLRRAATKRLLGLKKLLLGA